MAAHRAAHAGRGSGVKGLPFLTFGVVKSRILLADGDLTIRQSAVSDERIGWTKSPHPRGPNMFPTPMSTGMAGTFSMLGSLCVGIAWPASTRGP